MKKVVLGCLLFAGMISGLYAGSSDDAKFREYVEITKNSPSNPAGASVCADSTYRIIYMTVPMDAYSSNITPAVIDGMKRAMLAETRNFKEDVKVWKELKISIVYTLITRDKKVFNIALSYKDF